MILFCSINVTLAMVTLCRNNNIMHHIVLQTVQTYVRFNSVTSYKQCISYHKARSFLTNM